MAMTASPAGSTAVGIGVGVGLDADIDLDAAISRAIQKSHFDFVEEQ